MGSIVDVENQKQLSTTDIVINMDGGVGGSWSEVPNQLVLDQGDGEVFLSNDPPDAECPFCKGKQKPCSYVDSMTRAYAGCL